ncbi:hypothetical protein CDV31_013063 [Fusarium ambrosium]|uniref:Uncharacterized protein n=1 Tax=Fusarium ambrosium TaxID=131363 RepID=A0A428T5S8_9HYPO|nr:hypothetical protein CDV31_013063 [Fusarium ambrosium]
MVRRVSAARDLIPEQGSKDTLENNRGQGASRIREQRQGTPSFSTTDSPVHYPVFSLDYSRFEFARLLSQIVRCSTFSIATAKRRLRTAHESSNSQGIRIFAAHDGLHGYGDARRRNELASPLAHSLSLARTHTHTHSHSHTRTHTPPIKYSPRTSSCLLPSIPPPRRWLEVEQWARCSNTRGAAVTAVAASPEDLVYPFGVYL